MDVLRLRGGKKYQSAFYAKSPRVQVTCNVYAVYVMETVLGIPFESCHSLLSDSTLQSVVSAALGGFASWHAVRASVAVETLALLAFFADLKARFGWELFRSVCPTHPHSIKPRLSSVCSSHLSTPACTRRRWCTATSPRWTMCVSRIM